MRNKKSVRILAVVGGVLVIILISAQLTLNGRNSSAPGTSQPPAVSQTPSSPVSPPSTRVIAPKKTTGDKPLKNDAVLAAAQSTSKLSEAVFLPKAQMRQVVESLVVPNLRQTVEKSYLVAAKAMARGLNYDSLSQTQAQANYYVVTQKYLVQSFGRGQATIWLYDITHAVTPPDQQTVQSYAITHPGQTPPGQEYYVPSITIVQMKWLDGHWYWAGTKDPPPDSVPPQRGHPTFQQAVNAYLPYVRSFKNYADLQ